MHETDAMLRLVLALPDCDGPRLIVADWLDERGDPRGRFIRLQCELARLVVGDPRREPLAEECESLLKSHERDWIAPLRGLVSGWRFHRGFVETVFLDAHRFLQHGPSIFGLAPIRHLHLLDLGGHASAISRSPNLSRLTALTIFASHAGDSVARALAASPNLRQLQELNLGRNRIGNAGVASLATTTGLMGLTTLDLSENELTDAGAAALANATDLANLTTLNLSGNRIGSDGAHALLTSARLPRLQRLHLDRNIVPYFVGLHDCEELRRLRVLTLSRNRLDGEGLTSLVGSPHLRGLHTLDLSFNYLGEAGAERLARGAGLSGLRVLILNGCGITDDGMRHLGSSPYLGGVTQLKLEQNPTGGDVVRNLVARLGR